MGVVTVNSRDVTERKKAEEPLWQANRARATTGAELLQQVCDIILQATAGRRTQDRPLFRP